MCASWVGGCNHQVIVDRLSQSRHITPDGKVQFKAGNLGALFNIDTTLLSAVLLDDSICETDKRRIIADAKGTKNGGKRDLTVNDLIKAISQSERKFLHRPMVKYVVLTSCSATRLKTTVRYENSTISIGGDIPKAFRQARELEAESILRTACRTTEALRQRSN